jgi:hypothetical protein
LLLGFAGFPEDVIVAAMERLGRIAQEVARRRTR